MFKKRYIDYYMSSKGWLVTYCIFLSRIRCGSRTMFSMTVYCRVHQNSYPKWKHKSKKGSTKVGLIFWVEVFFDFGQFYMFCLGMVFMVWQIFIFQLRTFIRKEKYLVICIWSLFLRYRQHWYFHRDMRNNQQSTFCDINLLFTL